MLILKDWVDFEKLISGGAMSKVETGGSYRDHIPGEVCCGRAEAPKGTLISVCQYTRAEGLIRKDGDLERPSKRLLLGTMRPASA